MATSTTDMQEMQAADRGAETNLSTTSPSAQNSPLGLAKGASFPKLNEILAQPAVKKATPGIMIAVLLVFLVQVIWRCRTRYIVQFSPE
jgi:hypothetical protein